MISSYCHNKLFVQLLERWVLPNLLDYHLNILYDCVSIDLYRLIHERFADLLIPFSVFASFDIELVLHSTAHLIDPLLADLVHLVDLGRKLHVVYMIDLWSGPDRFERHFIYCQKLFLFPNGVGLN